MINQRFISKTIAVLCLLCLFGMATQTLSAQNDVTTPETDSKQQKEMTALLPPVLRGRIPTPDVTFHLWTNKKTESNGITKPLTYIPSKDGVVRLKNIADAAIYVYTPKETTKTQCCVLICPGGGYAIEAIENGGTKYAQFLTAHGITAAVLQYRLPHHHKNVPLADALEAMRILRGHAAQLGIDTHKIGVCGFSAGGHLASTLGTQYRKGGEGCRPDFMLLIYPVISSDPTITHAGTFNNLLPRDATESDRRAFSSELHVDAQTPPAFLLLGNDDTSVNPQNSIRFYEALVKNNVRAGLHIFSKGGHGFGMTKTGLNLDRWPEMTVEWLRENDFIK